MAQQIIDVGNVANDGTGDPLRTAFQIINENFTEVYEPPTSIANGSSRIDIAQDGDIYMTSNGVANVMVVSSTQVTITGDLAVTGNAILTGNILGDRIQNGTTIIDIQSPGGNANLTIGNVTNVAVFAPTGEYINGLLSVSGNITANNLNVGNVVSSSGNIIGGNLLTAGFVSATGNITGGNVSAVANITAANVNATNAQLSTATASGNITGGNILTSGAVSATGNITGGNIITAGSMSVASFVATGNITGGNILTSGIVSSAGNATFANLAIGSGTDGNAIIYGNLIVYGNTTTINSETITTNDLNITVGNNQNTGAALNNAGLDVGNNNLATWRFNNSTTSWQSNIAITPSSNATLALGGPSNYWGTAYLTTASVSGNVSVGNIVGGNLLTSGTISTTANITGGNIVATNIGNVAAANFDGNVANVLLGNGVFGNTPATLGALNYVQNSVSTSQTVYTTDTFPYTVVSASIATNSNPIQVIVTGDANPLSAGGWGNIQLYRDSTAIGQPVQYESSAANENVPFALQVIDVPPTYGTFTYSLKVNSLTANSQFGENSGPVLSVIEIQNVKGQDGAPYAWRTVSANGTNITSNVSEATITYTPANNLVISGNAVSNVITFSVSTAPTFTGNVTGGNILTAGLLSTSSNVVGSNINGNLFASAATIANANIGSYTTNALRVNGTGYIVNSATTDPYPGTGTLDVAAVTQPNVVIRAYSQTTSNTSGPVLQFVRKQQTGTALSSDLDAGRMKFWAIQPNNDTYNYIGEVAGITAGSGTDGQLELYSGLANVPQLVLTLNSSKQANFTGEVSAVGNINGGNLAGTNITGTIATASQPNITTLGTLGSLSVSGNINGGNLAGTNITGTIATASQTNITTVGTLGSLSVGGNITSGNLLTAGTTGTVSVNSIDHTGGNGVGNIGSPSSYFNTVHATATTALYADLAEKYLADKNYESGTVLSFGGNAEVTQSSEDSDRRIIGIVSSTPAYIMNSGLSGEYPVVVALQGRVPCLVQGTVQRGDMLVSAGNGRARAEQNPQVGAVLGKALQNFDGDQGTIEIVVGRI